MIGVDIQVLVCVCGFPVDSHLCAVIIIHLYTGVQEWQLTISFWSHGEFDVWVNTVEVCSESFHMILLYLYKCVINIFGMLGTVSMACLCTKLMGCWGQCQWPVSVPN